MVGAGYVLGRVLGDDYALLPFMQSGSKANTPEAQAMVKAALTAAERNEPIPDMPGLIALIDGPEAVDKLFSGDRLEPLLSVIERPPGNGDPAVKSRREDVYSLLSHIASMAVEPLRIGLAAAMARGLGRHRHLAPHLIEVARRDASIWNDVQDLVDHAANLDPGIQRFLDAHAGPDAAFVRKANDIYLNEMVRFRRLCEDRVRIGEDLGKHVVDGELGRMLQREFTVLEVSGAPSKRFVWLVSQARAIEPLIDDERMEILIDSTQRGSPDACALGAQLAIVYLEDDRNEGVVQELIDALGYGAMRQLPAADALLGLFGSLSTGTGGKLSEAQRKVRRRSFELLQRAGSANFEVRAMLGTHGLGGGEYPELTEEFELEPTKS
jgi:hypothetical protein